MASKTATRTPKDVARDLTARGIKTDAKRVRAWVRDHVAAYDDDGYTAHLYDAATYARIVKGMTERSKAERPKAAVKGRSGAVKGATVKPRTSGTRKAARTMGSGPVVTPKAPESAVAPKAS